MMMLTGQNVCGIEKHRIRRDEVQASRRLLILGGLLTLGLCFALALLLSPAPFDKPAVSDGPRGAALAQLITELRTEKKLVALAAMVTVDGQTVARAAVGERMVDRGVAVGLDDKWHLGSITKSFTATMIARLIEAGTLKWTDTVGDRFPDAAIHESWKGVTLEQLLTHTSGAPANFGVSVRMQQPEIGPVLTRARREAVLKVLAVKPESSPGTKFLYSNVGYTLAAVMAEQASGSSWEELVQREVFQPLNLETAGFGPPKSPLATLDQPRGHHRLLGKKTGVADTVDNTPIMGPSGAIHLSLDNLTAYAWEHLQGEKGAGKLLSAETFQKLHTPRRNDYACGWVRKAPTEALPHTVYWHNGSNTMWYALVAFIPETNMVVAVSSNDGNIKAAEAAAWKVVEAAVKSGQ